MQLVFEQIRAGGDRNFGYLLGDRDTGSGVLIDPSYSPDVFVQRARDQSLTITHVINTHGHADHTNGNARAAELTGAPIAAFGESSLISPDLGLRDGQAIASGGLRLQFLHVPGHCPGNVLFYFSQPGVAFVGDALFKGSIGRTDLPGGSFEQLAGAIREQIYTLPETTVVYPGHGPQTTVADEKDGNPYVTG